MNKKVIKTLLISSSPLASTVNARYRRYHCRSTPLPPQPLVAVTDHRHCRSPSVVDLDMYFSICSVQQLENSVAS